MNNTTEGLHAGKFAVGTLSGKYVDFQHPETYQIDILDIVAGLSKGPRFVGQTRVEMKVAEHCVNVYLFAALLHDAPEAYTGDIPKPLKLLLGHDFQIIEGRLEACIFEKFGIDYYNVDKDSIKLADNVACRLEAMSFCYNRGDDWNWSGEVQSLADSTPGYLRPTGWTATQAKERFMTHFWDLEARKKRAS